MRNRNTYKKFCTIMIALGLVFSGGQLAYAHSQELKEAEAVVASKPTIENLIYIHDLYRQDAQIHHSNHELEEAHSSNILANQIKNQIDKCIENTITSTLVSAKRAAISYRKVSECFDWANFLIKSSELEEIIKKYPSMATNIVRSFWIQAEHVYATAEHDQTEENYDYSKLCWNLAAHLSNLVGNFEEEKIADTKAIWAQAKSMQITADRTAKHNDYLNSAISWNFAARYSATIGDLESANLAINNAVLARQNANLARRNARI